MNREPVTGLRLGETYTHPIDALTEATGVVATRGAGKSYASAVLIEEAHTAGIPFVVLDPSGVYYGLRSSADGKTPGLPVYVLGGPHGDVPLAETGGRLTADVVVDTGRSFVLDLSDMSANRMRLFVADFLERLYDRKARERQTLLLVIDEADEFAPQKARGETARSLGAMERIAKRGRSRGLGVVLITQRTQALNKDVLDLIETLIAMRQLAERSRRAIEGWIADKHLRDERGVIESLQALPTGTAWVWSPLRGILEKVAIRRIRTFDTYATPKPGEVRREPKARAELDLAALGEQTKATVERAKADDPRELKKQIAELQRELAKKPAAAAPVVERVEISVLKDDHVVTLENVLKGFQSTAGRVVDEMKAMAEDVRLATLQVAPLLASAKEASKRAISARDIVRPRSPDPRAEAPKLHSPSAAPAGGKPASSTLTGPEQRILDAIAWLEALGQTESDQTAVAFLAGYTVGGGAFNNPRGALNTKGARSRTRRKLISRRGRSRRASSRGSRDPNRRSSAFSSRPIRARSRTTSWRGAPDTSRAEARTTTRVVVSARSG
jgi:hypothetical protein